MHCVSPDTFFSFFDTFLLCDARRDPNRRNQGKGFLSQVDYERCPHWAIYNLCNIAVETACVTQVFHETIVFFSKTCDAKHKEDTFLLLDLGLMGLPSVLSYLRVILCQTENGGNLPLAPCCAVCLMWCATGLFWCACPFLVATATAFRLLRVSLRVCPILVPQRYLVQVPFV